MDMKDFAIGILAIAVVVSVAAFGLLNSGSEQVVQEQAGVELPGYLSESVSKTNEGTPASDGSVISFAEDESGNSVKLITVSGMVAKSAAPELAYVTLSIETLDRSASKSQSDNAANSNKVMDALKAVGIAEDDLETASYSVREEFQWSKTLGKSESIGYKTINSIQVTVRSLSKVGLVIDSAVQAGANSVSNVSFALTKATQSELRTAALKDAAENARAKAQSIASGLGIGVGSVFSASESSSYATPVYYRNVGMDAVAESAPTPISPGDIEFTATVSVQFEIQ